MPVPVLHPFAHVFSSLFHRSLVQLEFDRYREIYFLQGICAKKPTYIRFLSIAVVIETVLVVEEEEEEVKELLVEVEEVLEKDELVEAEEKLDAPCMFLR